MSRGSLELRNYLRRRRAHMPTEQAAAEAGIPLAEARWWDEDEAKGMLTDIDISEPEPAAPAIHRSEPMARTARKPVERVEEIHQPDYDLAIRIYRHDIKPAVSKQAEFGQELSQAYKEIKAQAHIQPQAAKLAFKLDGMEESKRDDFLRSLNGLLKRMNIFMPADLIDVANGKAAGEDVIPASTERPKPQLATVPNDPPSADDSDLAEAAE
jgi:hypothetical protein